MDLRLDGPPGRTARAVQGPPCAMVIFGSSGDLTKRLLIPALYNLAKAGRLSDKFALIGVDRTDRSHEEFRAYLAEGVRSFVSDTGTGPVTAPFDARAWEFLAARMTHFLGKETVQNIMVLRFANGIFEPLWNRDHIDHVQITVAETVGVERRAGFYEETGALRDMVPNHVFQLLSLTAMEPPNSFAADAVRTEKDTVLDAVIPLDDNDVRRNVVRGQYTAGVVRGQPVKAYREEEGVAPDSMTETYVALRLGIDNWRWAGVPFYMRTGKALTRRTTEIAIQFKQVPFALFRDTPVETLTPNVLVMQIQPDEGISLQFGAKRPGPDIHLGGVRMDFRYRDYFNTEPSTGYETLVYDCMIGDQMLFQRADSVECGWAVVQPILDMWRSDKSVPLEFYTGGTAGPDAAEQLLWRSGRQWRPLA